MIWDASIEAQVFFFFFKKKIKQNKKNFWLFVSHNQYYKFPYLIIDLEFYIYFHVTSYFYFKFVSILKFLKLDFDSQIFNAVSDFWTSLYGWQHNYFKGAL